MDQNTPAALAVTVLDDCIASGQCVLTAPDVFALEGDGPARPLVAQVPSNLASAVRVAAETCPVEAIVLHRSVVVSVDEEVERPS